MIVNAPYQCKQQTRQFRVRFNKHVPFPRYLLQEKMLQPHL